MFSVAAWFTLTPKTRNKIRVLIVLVSFIACEALSCVFARGWVAIFAGVALYGGLTYLIIIHRMVREYVNLVGKHLSKKEKVVRNKTVKEYCLKVDELKGPSFPFKKVLTNTFVFFFRKEIPKSNFPKF